MHNWSDYMKKKQEKREKKLWASKCTRATVELVEKREGNSSCCQTLGHLMRKKVF